MSEPRLQSHLYNYLQEQGLSVVTVSRDRTKEQRKRGLEAFRDGKANVLLTTDSAARGLDIPRIAWVLHYDLPRSAQEYEHRAGRTGRAGEQGTSVVFADRQAQSKLRRFAKALRLKFEPY